MSPDTFPPSPETTLIILLGAEEWPGIPQFRGSKGFAKAAHELENYFLNIFGLPPENLLRLFNTDDGPNELDKKIGVWLDEHIPGIEGRSQAARDLVVYFVGHGGFAEEDFFLALRCARKANLWASTLLIKTLAHTIKEKARSLRRIIILDCCFAGAALPHFQGGDVAIQQTMDLFHEPGRGRGRLPPRGTSLLCATNSHNGAQLLPDDTNTLFTKSLVEVLTQGNVFRQQQLSLRDVVSLIRDVLPSNAPKPYLNSPDQSEGDVAAVEFFPNPARSLGTLVYRSSLEVACEKALAWSPDGNRIAFGSPEGAIFIWTLGTPHPIRYPVHQGLVDALAWSPKGNVLASACGNSVQIWSPSGDAEYTRVSRFHGIFGAPVRALSWSPDGEYIAVAQEGYVLVRGLGNHAAKRVLHRVYDSKGKAAAVEAVAWCPSIEQTTYHIASASDSKVEIWEAETGKLLLAYEHPDYHVVNSLAWSPDGRYIASASDLFGIGFLQVWDTTSGEACSTYESRLSVVRTLTWSPSGKRSGMSPQPYRIASGGNDTHVRVWNVLTGEQEFAYEGHEGEVTVVSWSPDGKYIASGSRDKAIHIWRAE